MKILKNPGFKSLSIKAKPLNLKVANKNMKAARVGYLKKPQTRKMLLED